MADSCDIGKLLNTLSDKLLYAWQTGIKNIKEVDDDLQCILLWRARLLEEKDNVFTIFSIMNSFLGRYLRERLVNVAAFYDLIAVIVKIVEY